MWTAVYQTWKSISSAGEDEPHGTTAVDATAVETSKLMDSLIQKEKKEGKTTDGSAILLIKAHFEYP